MSPRPSDAAALPHLIEAMSAAGQHDARAARLALDQAESFLPAGSHKARPDIEESRTAIDSGNWRLCWSAAHRATCVLTWAFPPDPSTCPPPPTDEPTGTSCTGCGATSAAPGRFCPACGAPMTPSPGR